MPLITRVRVLTGDLLQGLSLISNDQFCEPVPVLMNASIGQHIRHIIEIYQQLIAGYDPVLVNYANRKRDIRLETNIAFASQSLLEISEQLNREDKVLRLANEYTDVAELIQHTGTSYYRELIYSIDHTIHHMVLIRIALEFHFLQILPPDFGVAFSTLQYRKSCAQ